MVAAVLSAFSMGSGSTAAAVSSVASARFQQLQHHSFLSFDFDLVRKN
jgi:hypothetical protein